MELMETYLNDISLIKNIKKLEYLDLSDNNITDISFICNIKILKYLNLSGNPIKNVYIKNKNQVFCL
ncbi:leucine-rich repeat domain-containing protein [Clostridium taeniosporum]|uniref:leucine-rich repeat domain-containing protein n=1 Tax=Clostridium taeniosporum TaxID=394958 RepID=UPI0023B9CC66|nr:leucine-rich repeat domain-containing protein [Clostridium taeniosporum]